MANVVIPSNFPKRTTVTAGTHVIGIQDPDTNPISVLVPSSLLGGTSVNLSQFPQATTYADTDFIAAVRNPGAATPENILIPRSILTANALKIQGRDVLATAPTADQTLVWNAAGSAWEPRTVELSGNATQLQGRPLVSTAPAGGEALIYNSSTSTWEPGIAGGAQGPAGTITIGTTSTGPAAVTNTGTASAAVLNFTVPQGPQGLAGSAGPQGPSGTIAVGTVTLGAVGQAAVTNSGTSTAAVFNFTVPKGDTGATGVTGPAGPTGPQGPAGNPADYAALAKANLFYG